MRAYRVCGLGGGLAPMARALLFPASPPTDALSQGDALSEGHGLARASSDSRAERLDSKLLLLFLLLFLLLLFESPSTVGDTYSASQSAWP